MLRYDAKICYTHRVNPYGAIQMSPLAQAAYLRDAGYPLLAEWLLDGLITVKKSARLVDDLELRKVLRRCDIESDDSDEPCQQQAVVEVNGTAFCEEHKRACADMNSDNRAWIASGKLLRRDAR